MPDTKTLIEFAGRQSLDEVRHDPYAAMRLIHRLADALKAAEAKIACVRELHCEDAVSARYLAECCADECEHEDACPEREVTVCRACWEAAELANSYYGEEGIKDNVLYPCPTITALEGDEK